MSEHAKYSPSKLPRIVRCPGSVEMEKPFEQKESIYAAEGTALHELTEIHLKANEYNVAEHLVSQINYKLTKEHKEAVQEVLDWCAALHLQHADATHKTSAIEAKVSLEVYAQPYDCEGLEDVYGTLDYMFAADSNLYVVDWKYGKGVEVFPDSEQLLTYAAGALASYELEKHKIPIREIILVIGQPRLYSGEHFKIYETSPSEIRDWVADTLVPALNDIETTKPTIIPSDKACMWCLAKNSCEARKKVALETAAKAFAIHADLPDKVKDEDIADFLTMLPDLKKYIADIEQYAHHRIKNGNTIPGWKLVHGRSIRKWEDEAKAKEYYFSRDDLDPDDLVTMKFKSPTQIEKLLGKRNITEEDLALVIKPPGKPTLVKETDKRDAIEYQNAEEKFAGFAN